MLYIKISTDGLYGCADPQGIGSICQWNILAYCLANHIGATFVANPFTNIGHSSYNNITQEMWDNQYTEFFNFKQPPDLPTVNYNGISIEELTKYENVVVNITNKQLLVKNVFSQLDHYCFRNNLKDNINYKGKKYFNKDRLNISFHVRSNNPGDIPPTNPSMETFPIWINVNHLITLVEQLKNRYTGVDVDCYIHSQRTEKEFEKLFDSTTDQFQIKLKINRPPIEDIYHMTNSDCLILSKSSYAWISHLMNHSIDVYASKTFHQPLFKHVTRFNEGYEIL